MKLKKYYEGGETDPPLNIKEATAGARRGMEWEGGQLKRQPAPVYAGMLDEVSITPYTSAKMATQSMIDNKATGGLTPSYPLFDVMTLGLKPALTVGGKVIQAGLRKSGSLVKPAASFLNTSSNLKGIQKAYSRQMAVPKGANLSVADDLFQGNNLIGKGEAFNRSEALRRISDFQKDLSPVPFTHSHGTGADALEGIFKNKGLVGASDLKKSGKLVTGEDLVYQKAAGHLYDDGLRTTQSKVSTASIANPGAAAEYALEYGKGATNYPVVFGINPKAGASSRMSVPGGNIAGEAQFSGKIGLDEISNVFVPDAQKASFTKKYSDQLGSMKVASFEDYLDQAGKLTRGNIRGSKEFLNASQKTSSITKPSSSLSSAVTQMLARNSGLNKNVGSAIDGFKFTDNMLAKSSNTPLGLPEPITYYRGTTTDKFKDLMSPVSTTGNKTDRAANLRFFSPNKGVAKNYLEDAKDQGVGLSARINIQNPYRQSQTRLLTNEYVDDLIKKGYDAIQTNYDGSKSLRDAFEVIPLDKNIISNIKTHNKFNKGGILKLKKK